MLKKGIVYNYACKLNLKCAKNCYVLSKNNSFELYLCDGEIHDHDLTDLTKRRNILVEMFDKNIFSLENVNEELSKEGLAILDKYNFSLLKHRLKNKLKNH